VLRGRASDNLLDTYEEERLPIARSVLKGSDIGYAAMFSSSRFVTFARERILVPLLRLPSVQRAISSTSNQLDVNYRDSLLAQRRRDVPRPRFRGGETVPPGLPALLGFTAGPRAGDRAPDAEVLAAGVQSRLFDPLHGPQFDLLIFSASARTVDAAKRLDALATRIEEQFGPDVRAHLLVAHMGLDDSTDLRRCVLLDSGNRAHRTYGVTRDALYLIRPDGYVGMRVPSLDEEAVTGYLRTIFCATSAVHSIQ
jgi:hypothetical protein